jgi:hypothetical protein
MTDDARLSWRRFLLSSEADRMRSHGQALYGGGHRALWMALIAAASLVLSFAFACAAPFAALAALAALNLRRREAVIIVVASFLANQAIGFGALDYPRDALTFAWGVAMGAATLASLFTAEAAVRHLRNAHTLVRGGAVFLAAFLAYEAALYAATFVLGGAEAAFAASAIRQVFLIDATCFIGLLALDRALSRLHIRAAEFRVVPADGPPR